MKRKFFSKISRPWSPSFPKKSKNFHRNIFNFNAQVFRKPLQNLKFFLFQNFYYLTFFQWKFFRKNQTPISRQIQIWIFPPRSASACPACWTSRWTRKSLALCPQKCRSNPSAKQQWNRRVSPRWLMARIRSKNFLGIFFLKFSL